MSLDYKCGICGDKYDGERKNEAGGIYAQSQIISAHYSQGEQIQIEIVITAHHKGFFQFKLCQNDDITKRIGQDCLDQNVILVEQDGKIVDKYDINNLYKKNYLIKAFLPDLVTCKACVLQWRYHGGK